MQKLSQTEELARTLAARARRHALTPEHKPVPPIARERALSTR